MHISTEETTLAKTDISLIIYSVDLDLLQENIKNVVCCSLEKEFDAEDLNPNVSKLFRLAQLIIEYLLFSQQCLKGKRKVMEEQLKQERAEKEQMRNELTAKLGIIKSMKYEINRTKRKSNGNHIECHVCGKMFVSPKFLNSHLIRKHRLESETDENKDLDEKEVNELKNALLATRNELDKEKEASNDLVQQVKHLREHVAALDQQLAKQESSRSEKEGSESKFLSYIEEFRNTIHREMEHQTTIIDDLKQQFFNKEEEYQLAVQAMLKEQSSNFEEKILFLKTSIEQEILTKVATEKERETCGLLSNQANLRRDELVLPDNQRLEDSRTQPVPIPRLGKRGLITKSSKKVDESDDNITSYESHDEASEKLTFRIFNEKDQVTKRRLPSKSKQGDRVAKTPYLDFNREEIDRGIAEESSKILRNHSRSRSHSGAYLDPWLQLRQTGTNTSSTKKNFLSTIVGSLKKAGTFFKGKKKKKPWSSTLSLPPSSAFNIDFALPIKSESPLNGKRLKEFRSKTENVYFESPVKSSISSKASQQPRPGRAWSDSDLSVVKDANEDFEEKEQKGKTKNASKCRSPSEIKSKTQQKFAVLERNGQVEVSLDKKEDKQKLRNAESLTGKEERVPKNVLLNVANSSDSDESEDQGEITNVNTESYVQEKVEIQSRIDELTKSIEDQLSSIPKYVTRRSIETKGRKQENGPRMYDNASDS